MRAVIKFWLVCLAALFCNLGLWLISQRARSAEVTLVSLTVAAYLSGTLSAFLYRRDQPARLPRGITTAMGMVGLTVVIVFVIPWPPGEILTHDVRQAVCWMFPLAIFHALSHEFASFLMARPKPDSS